MAARSSTRQAISQPLALDDDAAAGDTTPASDGLDDADGHLTVHQDAGHDRTNHEDLEHTSKRGYARHTSKSSVNVV